VLSSPLSARNSRASSRPRRLVRRIAVSSLLLLAVSGCGDSSQPASSALIWRDIYSGPPPSTSSSSAQDVAACDRQFFVAGESTFSSILRAYDSADGTLRWQDTQSFDDSVTARGVACEGGRVYALWDTSAADNTAFLRAYDGDSGALLWELEVDEGWWNAGVNLAADEGGVFLLTRSGDEEGLTTAMDAWSLDGSTGTVRWQSHDIGVAEYSLYAELTISDEQVCTIRYAGSEPLLRCLDRMSGDLVWYADDVGEPGVLVSAQPQARTDFVAFGRGEGLSGVVAAYDPRDGELLWKREDFDAITNVHLYDGRVLVTAIDFVVPPDPDEPGETRYFRVTGLDRRGRTDWEDIHVDEGVRTSAVSDGKLFVAGEEGQTRIYDAGSGRLIAYQSPDTVPRTRGTWDIAAEGDRFALVGSTHREDPGHHVNFAARGFELSR
jgi:hypothetical protein